MYLFTSGNISLQMLSVSVCRYTLLLLVFLCGRFPWPSFSWTSLQMGKAALELFSVQSLSCSSVMWPWVSKEKGHSPVIFKSFSFVQNILYEFSLLRLGVLGFAFNSSLLFTNKSRRCQNNKLIRQPLWKVIGSYKSPQEKICAPTKQERNKKLQTFIFSFKFPWCASFILSTLK